MIHPARKAGIRIACRPLSSLPRHRALLDTGNPAQVCVRVAEFLGTPGLRGICADQHVFLAIVLVAPAFVVRIADFLFPDGILASAA